MVFIATSYSLRNFFTEESDTINLTRRLLCLLRRGMNKNGSYKYSKEFTNIINYFRIQNVYMYLKSLWIQVVNSM